ncbi:class II glutamine amidotransferase [Cypionkella aquatica]|uniref:Class II glutamine amidotransferase n=1 Tax=Cypionkella aquatica TaxID=1756042 RepID=A0AA37WYB0_9RHOB|nr:class II glutamine amidotransferase [Cypionkella aquatica]GLS85067.1 class II glutamine amidotransferase [Cypionkella aquatica]
MCRWAAYAGAPIFLEEIISRPGHSLIHQSHGATQCHSSINADGFGVAWYGDRPEPGLYRDVLPAWSDPNLRSLTAQVKSGLFLAHVRASTGTATSRNNCHPFVHGVWSFMHNGQVGGYDHFRRDADMMIPDTLYAARKGATDSEALFLVALAEGLDSDPRAALERASARFIALARAKGAAPHLRMTAALSDGKRLYAVRYATDDAAPSLYYRWSDTRGGMAVVSEPLEAEEGGWNQIASNTFCTFDGAKVQVEAFMPCKLVEGYLQSTASELAAE